MTIDVPPAEAERLRALAALLPFRGNLEPVRTIQMAGLECIREGLRVLEALTGSMKP